MTIENKFTRCAEDDPLRCQASNKRNQCPYKACDGSRFCPMHGGIHALRTAAKERTRVYNLSKWQARIGEHANHEHVKSLREEIGILRILLEGVMDMCKDSSDLLLYSNKISDLAIKIEKLVASCHRLETATGVMLDKHAALQLAGVIVNIIVGHVSDDTAIEAIGDEIVTAVLGVVPEAL